MQVHRSYQTPAHTKNLQAKEETILFIVSTLSHEDACQNPETLSYIKHTFATYPSLEDAKKNTFTLINQRKEQDEYPDLSFFIWKTETDKWTFFAEAKLLESEVVRQFKAIGIKDQWRFNQNTNLFIPVPLSYSVHQETLSATTLGSLIAPTYAPTIVTLQEQAPPDSDALKILEKVALNKRFSPHITCPISHKPYQNAVITPYGYSYNRFHLDQHLEKHATDPLAKRPLSKNDYIENKTLMTILFHLKEIFKGNRQWLLCPMTRLPIRKPVILNPRSANAKVLLRHNPTSPLFEEGVSYSKYVFLPYEKQDPISPIHPIITDEDLIPNLVLEKLLLTFESSKQEQLERELHHTLKPSSPSD